MNSNKHQAGRTITYGAWLSHWLTTREAYVKASALASYQQTVQTHILPVLGEIPLAQLTEQRLQEAVLFWLREGRCDDTGGLSERTVRSMVMLIKASLKAAGKAGYIPVQELDILFPKSEHRESVQTLTKQEQVLLTQHIYLHLTPKNAGILLCMHTGLRIGELCVLQWKDINLEDRIITVSKTLQRIFTKDASGQRSTRILITPPKTEHSVRVIPISSLLYPVLQQIQPKDPEIYVLTGKMTSTEPRTYREYYNRLLQKLDIRHVHFHGLRHTFATRLIENGVDYKTVSELLGHASVSITLNLYVHPHMEQKRKAVELLNFLF